MSSKVSYIPPLLHLSESKEHVHELEQYESANLVAYVHKKVAPLDGLQGTGLLKQKEVCVLALHCKKLYSLVLQIGYENEELLATEELMEKKEVAKNDLGTENSQAQIEKKLLVEPTANSGSIVLEPKIELKMVEKETKKQERKEDFVVPDVMQLFQSPEVGHHFQFTTLLTCFHFS